MQRLLWLTVAAYSLVGCTETYDSVENTRVSIEAGIIIGVEHTRDTFAWLGIPYAKPPIGELRWRLPQPAVPWEGIKQATLFAPSCVQFPNAIAGENAPESELVVGSEDCLTLNVFAPKGAIHSDQLKPVMFWIHGGSNVMGSAQTFDGSPLASTQDVIVVTINYRLGVFGWLRHEALRRTSSDPIEQSGNFGTLDMIAALRWVRRNISQFGGDPNRVTIFGESAGGRNIWSLIQTPLANGLFHGAITQSGSIKIMDPEKSERYGKAELDSPQFANNSFNLVVSWFGEDVEQSSPDLAKEMRKLSPDEVLGGLEVSEGGFYKLPKIFLDGVVFVDEPLTLFKDPDRYNSVPIITGSNRDEVKLSLAFDERWVDYTMGFFPRIKDSARYDAASYYTSNTWKLITADEPARVISNNRGAPIYVYRFDYDDLIKWPIDLSELLGAAHALDVVFLFGRQRDFPWSWLLADKQAADRLASSMMNYWGEFARKGIPGNGSDQTLPHWSAWRGEDSNTLLFNVEHQGGVRVIENALYREDLKAQLRSDDKFTEAERCEFYLQMFLNGFQDAVAFDREEYLRFVDGGCPDSPP